MQVKEHILLPFAPKTENIFLVKKNKKMILSNVGVIANLIWFEIINHSKNIELGQFVVMPNHIHGI